MNPNLTADTKPWYRHPWPWILMSGPFTVVVAGVFTAYLAVVSNDGLVADDYYKQGLAVNKRSVRDHQAVDLGVQAELMQGLNGGQIRVLLRGKTDVVFPPELALHIVHPTRSGVDQSVSLHADGAGSYSGKLTTPLSGRWHIVLEDEKNEWRLTGDWLTDKNASLSLPVLVTGVEKPIDLPENTKR
jgi:hypothetical protein